MGKRIMMLTNYAPTVIGFRRELIEKILKCGMEMYISAPYDKTKGNIELLGCKFVATAINRRGMNPFKDAKLFFRYMYILKRYRPDMVLIYTIKPNIYGSIACQVLKIKYMNTITGLGSGFSKSILIRKIITTMYRIALKDSFHVFFQNSDDLEYMKSLKMVKDNCYGMVPGSGVNLSDYAFFEYPPNGVITFLFIGRIMKDKGIDEFLKAAAGVKVREKAVRFVIIGKIEETESQYYDIIESYKANGVVDYLGYQEDVKPFIQSAHCIVNPSHSEGMSNVLLEAAAMGRPLIASNIPGCKETIETGKSGYIFEVGNYKALIYQLDCFLELSYDGKKEMGRQARRVVEERFDRSIVINEYMNKISEGLQ